MASKEMQLFCQHPPADTQSSQVPVSVGFTPLKGLMCSTEIF